MIDAEKILKNVRNLSIDEKNKIICGGKMLDYVCEGDYGNLSREILHICLTLYIRQGSMNGKHTYQESLKLVAIENFVNNNRKRWVYDVMRFLEDLIPVRVDDETDIGKEMTVRRLISFKPQKVKINIKEFITDLDKIYDENEIKLNPDDTTINKWLETLLSSVFEKDLSENDKYRLEQELNGVDEIVPMTIDIEKLNMEVPECLKN